MSGDTRKLSLAERKELVRLVQEASHKSFQNGRLGDDGVSHWREVTPAKLQEAILACFWERGTEAQHKLVAAWVRDAWMSK